MLPKYTKTKQKKREDINKLKKNSIEENAENF